VEEEATVSPDVTGHVTVLLLQIIKLLNPSKDRSLSFRLHGIADEYDTRPTGEWSKEVRQQQKADNFGRAYGMSEEKIAASRKPMIHVLREGRPVCEFTCMIPKDWPPGHAWVREGETLGPGEINNFRNCMKCFPPPELALDRNYFLNGAHELPHIKKSELRKQNKMLRDAKKEGKKWCKICLSGPCGLWEFADKGGDFCRRHK